VALEALYIDKVGPGNRNKYHRQQKQVVRHRVLGIKDSSKTVVRKSDSGRQDAYNITKTTRATCMITITHGNMTSIRSASILSQSVRAYDGEDGEAKK